jgi:hypothetical protein
LRAQRAREALSSLPDADGAFFPTTLVPRPCWREMQGVNGCSVSIFSTPKFPTTNKTKVLFESASAGTRPPQVRAVYPNLCAVGVGCSFDRYT